MWVRRAAGRTEDCWIYYWALPVLENGISEFRGKKVQILQTGQET